MTQALFKIPAIHFHQSAPAIILFYLQQQQPTDALTPLQKTFT
jgi:hypothetical protein